jgi:hypothetical protein
MANYSYSATFQDVGGRLAKMQGRVSSDTIVTATTKVQGLVEIANNPSPANGERLALGALISVSISQDTDFSAWSVNDTPEDEAENQKGLRLVFNTAAGKTTYLTIPTGNEVLKETDGSLNTDDENLSAFILAVTGASNSVDSNGSDITSLRSAYFTYAGKDARD